MKDNSLLCSMRRKRECLDNAIAESFFGTLKTELVDHEYYRSKEEAKKVCSDTLKSYTAGEDDILI